MSDGMAWNVIAVRCQRNAALDAEAARFWRDAGSKHKARVLQETSALWARAARFAMGLEE